MCTVKTQKHRFPFIIISTIIPNDILIHGQNAQWSVILDKCTEISSKYRRSAMFFNALSFCFDFSSFQTTHRNKNKLRTNWGWSSQKIKNNEPRQNLLVLKKSWNTEEIWYLSLTLMKVSAGILVMVTNSLELTTKRKVVFCSFYTVKRGPGTLSWLRIAAEETSTESGDRFVLT